MKNLFYPAALVLMLVVGAAAYYRTQQKEAAVPALKERSANIGLESEWLNAKNAIEGLIATLKKNPDDVKTKLHLALAYIGESRVTGDHGYYDAAALKLLDQILVADAAHFEAICAKATVLLSQHHFAEAKVMAEKAIAINRHSAFGYGIMTDATVELGEYDRAIVMADSMNAMRPDTRSYSRIAYLREILGQPEGAKEVMAMAVESGYPGLEQTEWCRVQLGHLYEISGDTSAARQLYEAALMFRPNYAYANAGLGRIARIKGQYDQAITYFKLADESVIDFAFQEAMAETYELAGQPQKAREAAQKVIKMLQYDPNTTQNEAEAHGHYSDRELALAYLRVGDQARAILHAEIEYKRRPLNIDANETLAWCYFNAGKVKEALPFAKVALKTNCKNAVLNWRMGQVLIANGLRAQGESLVLQASKTNPFLTQASVGKAI
jgi:tetratricopeptide (TPR) repeat protein